MRYYSTTAGEMVLQVGVTAGDTTIIVDTVAGLPVTFPYTLLLDYGTASEEVVDVTAASGTTLTVTRGGDGTIAQSHSFGAKIRHGVTARDYRESREHEAATAAHGVATVAGLAESQTLDNKTFQASADHVPAVFKQRSGNTASIAEVQDSTGAVVAAADDSGLVGKQGSTAWWRLYYAGAAVLLKRVFSVRVSDDVHAITGDVSGTPTGRFIRLLSGVTELFSVSAAGDVAAHGGTFGSDVTVTGNVTASGTVTGTNIATLTTGQTTNAAAITAVSDRVTTLEGNLGSQTTFVASSAAKDGKKIHWGTATVNGDAGGIATVTHGAGFTPTSVQCNLARTTGALYDVSRTGNYTATTFDFKVLDNSGASVASATGIPVVFFCGE